MPREPPQFAPAETLSCTEPPHLKSVIPVGDGAALLRRRPDVREAERELAAATAEIGVATADLFPRISLTGLYGGAAANLSTLTKESGLTWGVGPSVRWIFPNQEGPRARIRQAKAETRAARANFDSVVLHALEETEQNLARYNADLDQGNELVVAQNETHEAYRLAHDAFLNGSISTFDLLTTEQALVASDSAIASADATIAQDQIAVFQSLGGGWTESAKDRP